MITSIFAGDNIENEIILNIDDSYNLLKTFDNFGEEERIYFTSNNEDVCYSYGSLLIGKNVGSCIVTAENSVQNDACRVYVKEPMPTIFTRDALSYLYGFDINSKYLIDGKEYTSDENGKIEIVEDFSDKTVHIVKKNFEAKCNSDEFLLKVGHHHFYSKEETVPPTCLEDGYTKHICSCKEFTVDGYIGALGHNMTDFSYDETSHYRVCNNKNCDHIENFEPHKFDNDCDKTCNVCGYIRAVSHKFTDECYPVCTVCGIKGNTNHKYLYSCSVNCLICGEERTAQHIYDSDSDMTCNICGYVRLNKDEINESPEENTNPELSKHRFSKSYTKTKRYHTKKCLDCGYSIKDAHIFDGPYDKNCNICGYERKLVGFPDVKDDNSYFEAIRYVSSLDIFKGYKSGLFGPSDFIQTQDLILALARFDMITLKNFDHPLTFEDVIKKCYYFNAVVWGNDVSIYKGITKTLYGIGKPLTYKQALTIIYRYAKTKGIYFEENTADETETAVLFALQNGFITADDVSLLDSFVKRQRIADIFYNIIINKIILL